MLKILIAEDDRELCHLFSHVLMKNGYAAKDAFDDMRMGFLSGTDDYMVKPINVN